ncbi:MAG TPA: hypothetical protein VNZ06_11470 [Steroidobacteraceae bacterium]|jgi:hypothetical protein|nr:hypothetical protein [Steroidobacteraceae bacterium]
MLTTKLRFIPSVLFGLSMVGTAVATESESQSPQPAVWQTHHAQFDYFGVTSRYTCDGLETKVRQILEYLGARPDLYVVATGCPRGPESFSRTAWVRVDFSTLSAAAASGSPADAIAANWTPLKMNAQRPAFMGDGDCELVDHMRKLLTDNFSWRGKVAYRTDCPIDTTEFHDYQIQGEVLKASGSAHR